MEEKQHDCLLSARLSSRIALFRLHVHEQEAAAPISCSL